MSNQHNVENTVESNQNTIENNQYNQNNQNHEQPTQCQKYCQIQPKQPK